MVTALHALDLPCGTRMHRTPHELYRFWRELQNLPRYKQLMKSGEIASTDAG